MILGVCVDDSPGIVGCGVSPYLLLPEVNIHRTIGNQSQILKNNQDLVELTSFGCPHMNKRDEPVLLIHSKT